MRTEGESLRLLDVEVRSREKKAQMEIDTKVMFCLLVCPDVWTPGVNQRSHVSPPHAPLRLSVVFVVVAAASAPDSLSLSLRRSPLNHRRLAMLQHERREAAAAAALLPPNSLSVRRRDARDAARDPCHRLLLADSAERERRERENCIFPVCDAAAAAACAASLYAGSARDPVFWF